MHKQPTAITIDAGQPTALTSTIVYDAKGRPLRSSKPGSTGADPGTTLTVLYTAGAQTVEGIDCGGRPEWAGQPCVTKVAGPATGHDPSRMATNLPVKRVEGYNRFGSPTVVSESATGPVDGTGVTQARTTVTEYDDADRITSVQITGTGPGVGAEVRKTTTAYDPVTGEVAENRSVDASGATVAAVTKRFDKLGRLIAYSDGAGATTTTVYDRFGQPSSATDTVKDAFGERTIGSTAYTYGGNRGFLTSFTDSVAGDFAATWGPDGQLQTQTLPGGVKLSIEYDAARVPVRRTYARASDGVVIASDSVVENHRGQWVRHVSDTGVRDYEYDRLGRLVRVEDSSAATAVCTTRTYGFATVSNPGSANRTSFGTATGAAGAGCVDPTSTAASTYDSADRLVTSPGTAGSSWVYDPLGRVTSMATPDGAGTVSNGFYVNDLVASQTQPGVEQVTWSLDPLHRRSVFESRKWVNDAWASSVTKVSHYGSDTDEPGWVQEDTTLPEDVTRYVSGVEGSLAVTTKGQDATGGARGRVLQLVDLHGDVTATVPIDDGASSATWSDVVFRGFDEFGVPQPLTGGAATTGPPVRYGWLGGAQRSAEALGGVVLMGVRLYSPATGRFLSVDPVAGGSASAYDYCNGDPVNCTDLGGTFSWKGALKALAVVGEVASMIPGPIGAAAAGVSSVAYLATGNKGKALEMGVTAAAQLVGAGAGVRVGFKIASAARKAGQAQRALPKIARAKPNINRAPKKSPARSCRVPGRSFAAGTQVLMADGTTRPIEDVEVGDLVLTTDPLTGISSAQPVITPITDIGTKELFELTLDAGGDPLIVTGNHSMWDQNAGWVQVEAMRAGATLRSAEGESVAVARLQDRGEYANFTVYNLSIAQTHTFYVFSNATSILVHNCDEGDTVSPGGFARRNSMRAKDVIAAIHGSGKRSSGVSKSGAVRRNPDIEICSRCGAWRPQGGSDWWGNIYEGLEKMARQNRPRGRR